MKKSEFYQYCADNGKTSVLDIKVNFTATLCDCGDKICKGWQLTPNILSIRNYSDKIEVKK